MIALRRSITGAERPAPRNLETRPRLSTRRPSFDVIFLLFGAYGREGILLSCECGLVHQATLRNGEHREASIKLARCGGVPFAATHAGTSAGRTSGRACSGRDGDRAHTRTEGELAAGEFVERALILKKDDLTVGLATRLKADAELSESDVADIATLLVDTTAPARATESEAAFADRREDGIAVTAIEERGALTGVSEEVLGFGVLVGRGMGRECECREAGDQKAK